MNRTEETEGKPFERGSGPRRSRPAKDLVFDYKDPSTLGRFMTEHGRVVPGRVSRLSAKQQRQLTQAIKRARHLALLPYCDKRN